MSYTDRRPPRDDADIADMGAALWRNRLRIAAIVFAAGALGYVFLSTLTPLYSAQSRVLIEHEESAFTRPAIPGDDTRQVLLDQEAVESQVQVILSRDLSIKVAKALDLASLPEFNELQPGFIKSVLISLGLVAPPSDPDIQEVVVDAFRERLSVYQVSKSRVIAIDFTSEDPELAARAANALAQAYLAWHRQDTVRRTRDATEWLKRQIEDLRVEVAEAEEKAERFRAEHGLYAGSNNVTLNSQQLSELNSQIIVARAQRSEAEARAKLIEDMLKTTGDVDSASDVLKSETIIKLLEQRVQVQRQLAELSATLKSGHPRMKQLSSELGDLRAQIRAEARKVVQGLQNEAQIAGAREASLRASLAELKQKSARSSEDEIKLRALEREAKSKRDLLESYLARFRDASARRDPGALPSNAAIISRAHASSTPSFPKKGPLTGLIMAIAALLSIGIVLARAVLAPKPPLAMTGPRTNAPSLLPPSHFAADKEEEEHPPQSVAPRLRSLEAVMMQIQLRLARVRPLQVLIASSRGSDAASDAVAVARALASRKRSVVLVDLSRAASAMASILDLPRTPGYYDLVSGEAEFDDIVQVDPQSAVQIICAGGGLTGQRDSAVLELPRVLEALDAAYDATVLHADSATLAAIVELLRFEAPQTVVVCANVNGMEEDDPIIDRLIQEGRLVAVYDKSRPQHRKFGRLQFGNRAASL